MQSPPAHRDVGRGTAYERWAIYRLLRRLGLRPTSALEGPLDGFAGMPGLHLLPLAAAGTRVTVAHRDPEVLARVRRIYERSGAVERLRTIRADTPPVGLHVDAVFCFNALPLARDWRAYLADTMRCCDGHAIVAVTNRTSYGARLRRLTRGLDRGATAAPELFDHPATDPALVERELARYGTVVACTFVDCPWWPDLFVPAGQTLTGATCRRLLGRDLVRPARRFLFDAESFPFVTPAARATVAPYARWHPRFEGAPPSVARHFAHHRAYLVRRG